MARAKITQVRIKERHQRLDGGEDLLLDAHVDGEQCWLAVRETGTKEDGTLAAGHHDKRYDLHLITVPRRGTRPAGLADLVALYPDVVTREHQAAWSKFWALQNDDIRARKHLEYANRGFSIRGLRTIPRYGGNRYVLWLEATWFDEVQWVPHDKQFSHYVLVIKAGPNGKVWTARAITAIGTALTAQEVPAREIQVRGFYPTIQSGLPWLQDGFHLAAEAKITFEHAAQDAAAPGEDLLPHLDAPVRRPEPLGISTITDFRVMETHEKHSYGGRPQNIWLVRCRLHGHTWPDSDDFWLTVESDAGYGTDAPTRLRCFHATDGAHHGSTTVFDGDLQAAVARILWHESQWLRFRMPEGSEHLARQAFGKAVAGDHSARLFIEGLHREFMVRDATELPDGRVAIWFNGLWPEKQWAPADMRRPTEVIVIGDRLEFRCLMPDGTLGAPRWWRRGDENEETLSTALALARGETPEQESVRELLRAAQDGFTDLPAAAAAWTTLTGRPVADAAPTDGGDRSVMKPGGRPRVYASDADRVRAWRKRKRQERAKAPGTPKKPGRPRKWASDTERKAAWRERQRQRAADKE